MTDLNFDDILPVNQIVGRSPAEIQSNFNEKLRYLLDAPFEIIN